MDFEETYNIHQSLREELFSISSSQMDCKAYLRSILSKDHNKYSTKTNKHIRVALFQNHFFQKLWEIFEKSKVLDLHV